MRRGGSPMSYELNLIRLETHPDPRAAVEAWIQQPASKELNPGPAVAAKESRKRSLAEALMRFDPRLSIAEFDYAGLAVRQTIPEAEVRQQYRHIELEPDDDTGIQITLWDDTADITFPEGYPEDEAPEVLRRAWDYLTLLQQTGGFAVYDPQLEEIVDLSTDFDTVLAQYSSEATSTYEKVRALKRRRTRKR